MRKGGTNPKHERKKRPEMSSEQEPFGVASERTTTISEIVGSCPKPNPRKTITCHNRKQDTT
jgi:hypothetical protein